MSTEKRSAARLTCSGCGATWTGVTRCHCTGCHETLAGIGMFDAHRRDGRCLAPYEAGAERLIDGVWRGPEWDADVFGRAS